MSELQLDDATMGQMLRIVSHDLRNPLAVIISNLGYLQSALKAADSDIAETLVDTVTSCDDLKHIISNIELLGTTLANTDLGGASNFEVRPITLEVVERSEPLAHSHGVKLVAALTEDEVGWARGRGLLYERALANILRNSIQHAPPGTEVRVELTAVGNRCVVTLLDKGQLIDVADAFTAVGQIHAKASGTGRYGRGFGLLIAKIAAAGLGASLDVREPRGDYPCVLELSFERSLDSLPVPVPDDVPV